MTKAKEKMISENFGISEYACRCGCGLCDPDPKLVYLVQRMRTMYGKPIDFESAHRCPAHNKAVGGALASWHIFGKAVDIRVTSGKERHELLKLAFQIGFTGIGLAKTFIHVDVGHETPTTWFY